MFESDFKPSYMNQDPTIAFADEVLRHKLMVRYKIEGRGTESGLKRMVTSKKLVEK